MTQKEALTRNKLLLMRGEQYRHAGSPKCIVCGREGLMHYWLTQEEIYECKAIGCTLTVCGNGEEKLFSEEFEIWLDAHFSETDSDYWICYVGVPPEEPCTVEALEEIST